MQIFNLDISAKRIIPLLNVKQRDVGTKILVNITDNGEAYPIPEDAVWSVWFSGPSGKGNYTAIDGESAFAVEGNTVTVELIVHMLNNPGLGQMSLVMNSMEGVQLGLWNIPYYVECLPGANGSAAENYYTAFHEDVVAAQDAATEAGVARNQAEFLVNGAQIYAENAEHYAGLARDSAAMANDAVREIERTAGAALSDRYDLKDGYSYTEDVYISTDGTETTLTSKNFKCVDYVPVKAGTEYVAYCVGYALYDADKAFISAVIDTTGGNISKTFTPTTDGYVRLTINSEDISYARFCKISELKREWWEYETAPNPFFDPRRGCNVHLYGDSNSEGYGLEDTSLAWSNRIGALIERLPETIENYRLSGYANKATDSPYMVMDYNSLAQLTAYTSEFTITAIAEEFEGFFVYIDNASQGVMTKETATPSGGVYTKTFYIAEGLHTLSLMGPVTGKSVLVSVKTKKSRNFTNHAVFGQMSNALPKVPEGDISIVMYGTNDRMLPNGSSYYFIWDFYRKCKNSDIVPYIFTPIPTRDDGEEHEGYLQEIGGVISQLPPDCINIYKDMQMIELLSGETIFSDNLHLNERGHELLYAIAASKLGLAALNSELSGISTLSGDLDEIIAMQETLIGG